MTGSVVEGAGKSSVAGLRPRVKSATLLSGPAKVVDNMSLCELMDARFTVDKKN